MAWAQQHGVEHLLIQPGRPVQNGYFETFNGKFRDQCLDEHSFTAKPGESCSMSTCRYLAGGCRS